MVLWNGSNINFGIDGIGPGVVVSGGPLSRHANTLSNWELEDKTEQKRTWRLKNKGTFAPIESKQINPELLKITQEIAQTLEVSEFHPLLTSDAKTDCQHLCPKVNPKIITLYIRFLETLKNEFGILQPINKEAALICIEGMDPQMLVSLTKTQKIFVPELPPAYLLDQEWIAATFQVTLGMEGPNIDLSCPMEDKLLFIDIGIKKNKKVEGYVYLQAVRKMLAWANWTNDSNARFASMIMSMFAVGYRTYKV